MTEGRVTQVPRRHRYSNWQNGLGVFLSLLVIIYVLYTLDWKAVLQIFKTIDYGLLVFSFLIFLVNYLFRTLRFRYLLELQAIPFLELLGVTSLYGMYLYLMPAKTGELSFPLLLKDRLKISFSQSTATLIVARFLDFATIALFLPFVLAVFWKQINIWIRTASVILVITTFMTGFLALWFIRTPGWLEFLGEDREIASYWLNRLKQVLKKVLTILKEIDDRHVYGRLWLVTSAIWICVQANLYYIVHSLGYSMTFLEMTVVMIIMIPMTLLPLQGVANLGTHEIGWVTAFALFGYPRSTALGIAVSTHIILLAFVLALGFLGGLLIRVKGVS